MADPKKSRRRAKLHSATQGYCCICDDHLERGESADEGERFICMHKTRRISHGMCLDHMKVQLLLFLREQYGKSKPKTAIRCCGNVRSKHRDQICTHLIDFIGKEEREKKGKRGKSDFVAEQLLDIIIKDEELYRWYRLVLARISPHCAICPSCSEVAVDVPVEQTHIICPYCQKDWCRKCMTTPYHEGAKCSRENLLLTIYQVPGGEGIRKGVEKGEIKLCPGCNTLTTKHGGCNHVTCRQCDIHWCWLCGDQIPADYPQSHFNSDHGVSSCRGRLFQ